MFNCENQDIFCGKLYDHFYFPEILRSKRSSIILKDEIHKNLPKIKVKIIVVLNSVFFGNHMIALSNIIYYCEILGIKNLYLNSKYDFFIKNDIITDKIHISIKSIDTLNCSSQDIFCGRLFDDFYFPKVIRPKRSRLIKMISIFI